MCCGPGSLARDVGAAPQDPVRICDEDGSELARCLVNYNSADVRSRVAPASLAAGVVSFTVVRV